MGRHGILGGVLAVIVVAGTFGVITIVSNRETELEAPAPPLPEPEHPGLRVSFRQLPGPCMANGPEKPARIVFASPEQLTATWTTMCPRWAGPPHPPQPPQTDFARRTYVLVARGAQGSTGYGVRVTDVRHVDGQLVVYVDNLDPLGWVNRRGETVGCALGWMITFPHTLIEIDSPKLPVAFRTRTRSSCEE